MPLIECVPNISEGRRVEIVATIAEAVRSTHGARLLDVSSDRSHNRSVLTLVGDASAIERAVMALYDRAVAAIDLRIHRGEHPRFGAVDVIPVIPLEGVTMAECVALAKQIGAGIARRFQVPVYLYEEASTNAARKNLEDIRRGGFEGLPARMATGEWTPDFGPPMPHPTAGASIVGARNPLIAYNINLATDRIEVARRIAAAVRQSGGGLPGVKALGIALEERGIVQVSTNLTNYEQTSLRTVFDMVKKEANRHGVAVVESEIVGLVPAAALNQVVADHIQLKGFNESQILESRLT
jgi:glutamate formiminotransferase